MEVNKMDEKPFLEVLVGVGRANLFEHGFKHINVEINHRAKLYQKAHGHGIYLSAVYQTVFHHGTLVLVGLALAIGGQHAVKFKVLTKNSVVKAEVERL